MEENTQEKQIAPQQENNSFFGEVITSETAGFVSAEEISKTSQEKLSALKALYSQQLGFTVNQTSGETSF
ncbi:hypothetical protein [Rufibacter radiotolerans]|nr:hypothetical protein [Rufibacter radiotolerans]